MWWLKPRAAKASQDRGAIALIIVIVLPVVLLGIGALIIDAGGWYAGRAQDQNGADAAAIAVADSCAAGACDPNAASSYVNDSSSPNGGLAHQYLVCGVSELSNGTDDPNLPTCASQGVPENNLACPVAPLSNYVDVLAMPKNSDGSGTITSFFGKGNQPIGACAQSAWGPAGYPDGGIAMTVSYCQWKADTGGGTSYTPAPPYPASLPSPYPAEHLIQLSQIGDPTTCTPPQGASALPGGFGEVVPDGQDQCTTAISSNGWYSSNTGAGNSNHWVDTCASVFAHDQANQTVVGIPVFDALSGSGSGGEYHLSNLAGFVITAYYFQTGNGGWAGSYIPDSPYKTKNALKNACTNSVCIVGYYVQYVDSDAPLGSGTNYGVTAPPRLVG
jgi:hypothetical protein